MEATKLFWYVDEKCLEIHLISPLSASLYSVPIRSRMETEMEIGDAAKHLQSCDGFDRIVVDANVVSKIDRKRDTAS